MAKTATAIIKKAQSFLGVKESPAGSNKVKFNTDYYGREVSGAAYPWCCAFVWDIFRMCDATDLFFDGQKTAYCQSVANWGKNRKLTVAKNAGKKGDLILFDWNKDGHADHIGFILKKNADGTYQTIEGNTSVGNDSNGGCVMERKRAVSTIHSIVRPKYVASAKGGTKTKKSVVPKENPYQEPSTNVRMKQTGNSVKWVQWELKKSGYSLAVDGNFGKNTKAAVQAFQKKKGLVVDGIVGKKTRTALKKAQ